jgi:acyl carrier protein
MSNILPRLIAVVANEADKDPTTITAASTFDEIGLDSLAVVEVILRIEEEFNVSVPDEKAHEFKTIGEVAAFLENVA